MKEKVPAYKKQLLNDDCKMHIQQLEAANYKLW